MRFSKDCRPFDGNVFLAIMIWPLRRLLDAPVPGNIRRGRQKPGGKTRVKEIRNVWIKGGGCAGTKL